MTRTSTINFYVCADITASNHRGLNSARDMSEIEKQIIGNAVLYRGDCLKIMTGFQDQEFDLCYADPPFNTGDKIGWKTRSYGEGSNDDLSEENYQKFCNAWFAEARRVSKKIVFTPGVGNIGRYPSPLWCVVIDKPSAPSFHKFGGFNCWEPLFVYDKPHKKLPRDVVRFDSQNFIKDGREEHPCPDNHNMVDWILDTWSLPGEKILDPFLGSGTLAVCATQMNRQATGIEKQKKWFDLSCERTKNAQRQKRLFA